MDVERGRGAWSPQRRRGCHAAARVVTTASTRPRAWATSGWCRPALRSGSRSRPWSYCCLTVHVRGGDGAQARRRGLRRRGRALGRGRRGGAPCSRWSKMGLGGVFDEDVRRRELWGRSGRRHRSVDGAARQRRCAGTGLGGVLGMARSRTRTRRGSTSRHRALAGLRSSCSASWAGASRSPGEGGTVGAADAEGAERRLRGGARRAAAGVEYLYEPWLRVLAGPAISDVRATSRIRGVDPGTHAEGRGQARSGLLIGAAAALLWAGAAPRVAGWKR